MAHKLLVDTKDSVNDNRFIYVTDLSIYDAMLLVKHRTLQVRPPYADAYVKVDFPRNEVVALNSISLCLSKSVADLPDGPYYIHFSASPNDKLRIDFVHYRVANLMNSVLGKMASNSVETCNSIDACGNVELDKQENTLLHIWMLLKGAQALGKEEHLVQKAKDTYNQALREYDKLFNNKPCVGC